MSKKDAHLARVDRRLGHWRLPSRAVGGDLISFSSVMFSAAGGIVGIWLGYRFGE